MEMREYIEAIAESCRKLIISKPATKQEEYRKIIVQKKEAFFQMEKYTDKQVFHENLSVEELETALEELMQNHFRQLNGFDIEAEHILLVSKKGVPSYKKKKLQNAVNETATHNRKKNYLLEEGKVIPPLVDMGIFTAEGKIVRTMYDKFKQINRFVEIIDDYVKDCKKEKLHIIDFGCGKSYLTFAMYYYLRELKGYDVNIIGLDLKTDVIEKCNSLALRYGYEKLHFYHGDIADYEGVSCVDMVVTLHACDTATDYALAKAVEWGAEVILSVPCCQHEVNKQIKNEMLEPVLRYGILKERMSALITDAVRADLLESKGYDTQILEFIDMEHTPKNLLIRAVRTGKRSDQGKVEKMLAALNIHPTLDRLLNEKEQEGSVR